jgi:nucleoside-diphosphate-sugar epimerase
MTVLDTGTIGFIGARCSLNLNKHGYDIVGFGNFIR